MNNMSKIEIRSMYGIKERKLGPHSYELTGANGTGKTSVIDAIRYALTNRSDRKYIVRDGENEGEILIETDAGLSITRKARTDRADYKSVKKNGLTVPGPESFLRDLVTPLQLSPVEFMEMDEKKQNAIILDMIEYPWNLETIRGWFGELPADVNYDQNILSVLNDIQAENGSYFQSRQDINRTIRAKKAIVDEIRAALPAGYDGSVWEETNLSELYTEIEKIRKSNENIEKAKRLKEGRDGKIHAYEADREIALAVMDREITAKASSIDAQMASLKEQIASLEKEKAGLSEKKADREKVIQSEYKEKVARHEAEISAFSEYEGMELRPVSGLLAKAEEAERMKSHVNEWRRMLSLQEEVESLSEQSARLTEKIEKARRLPGEILESATIPIQGLTVKDGIPLINGLPVSNLSEGEKLDLCIDVAIQNPAGLQIILIDGVEKLSTEVRERLYRKCMDKGLQVIATRTTDDTEMQMTVIELGKGAEENVTEGI